MLIAKAKELGAKTERNRFRLLLWVVVTVQVPISRRQTCIRREAASADNTAAVISDRGAEKRC